MSVDEIEKMVKRNTKNKLIHEGRKIGLFLAGSGFTKYQMVIEINKRLAEIELQKAIDDARTITVEAIDKTSAEPEIKALPAPASQPVDVHNDYSQFEVGNSYFITCYQPGTYSISKNISSTPDSYFKKFFIVTKRTKNFIYFRDQEGNSFSRKPQIDKLLGEKVTGTPSDKSECICSWNTANVPDNTFQVNQDKDNSVQQGFNPNALKPENLNDIPGNFIGSFTFAYKEHGKDKFFTWYIFKVNTSDICRTEFDKKYFGESYLQFLDENKKFGLGYIPQMDRFEFRYDFAVYGHHFSENQFQMRAVEKQVRKVMNDILRSAGYIDENNLFIHDNFQAFRILAYKNALEHNNMRLLDSFIMPDNPFTSENDKDNPLSWSADTYERKQAMRLYFRLLDVDGNKMKKAHNQADKKAVLKEADVLREEIHKLFDAQSKSQPQQETVKFIRGNFYKGNGDPTTSGGTYYLLERYSSWLVFDDIFFPGKSIRKKIKIGTDKNNCPCEYVDVCDGNPFPASTFYATVLDVSEETRDIYESAKKSIQEIKQKEKEKALHRIATVKFIIGKIYTGKCSEYRSVSFTVTARTDKNVTIVYNDLGEEKTAKRKLYVDKNGIEYIKPLGTYGYNRFIVNANAFASEQENKPASQTTKRTRKSKQETKSEIQQELKCCIFCGSKKKPYIRTRKGNNYKSFRSGFRASGTQSWFTVRIKCRFCGKEIECSGDTKEEAMRKAIAKWNCEHIKTDDKPIVEHAQKQTRMPRKRIQVTAENISSCQNENDAVTLLLTLKKEEILNIAKELRICVQFSKRVMSRDFNTKEKISRYIAHQLYLRRKIQAKKTSNHDEAPVTNKLENFSYSTNKKTGQISFIFE